MLWLYIQFISLPVDMYQRATAQTGPLAIVSPPSSHSPRILSTNLNANERGIKQGMTLHTALCLEPALTCVAHNEQLVHEQLLSLAEWAYHYSASITPFFPDGLLLEVGSMRRLFGGLRSLWKTLSEDLSSQDFHHQMATGFTPLAARILACSNQGSPDENPEDLARALGGTPLHHCFLPEGCAEKLNRVGINQLRQVLDIPRYELGKRFGHSLCLHLSRILGEIGDPQHLFKPPERFHRKLAFCHDITDKSGLLFPLNRLFSELEIFLRQRQLCTDQVELTLVHRQTSPDQVLPDLVITIRSATAQSQKGELLQLALLRLDTIHLNSPVTRILLHADRLFEVSNNQKDLFSTEQSGRDKMQLVSRLQARLGNDKVSRLIVREDHQPEKAGYISTCFPRKPNTKSANSATSHAWNRPTTTGVQRPLLLCDPPCLLKHPPAQILQGPERIATGWWTPDKMIRDYYIARFGSGNIAWIYQDCKGEWFIHGWFS